MDETREALLEARKRASGGGPYIPSAEERLAALQELAHLARVFYQMLLAEGFQPEEALHLTGRLFPN